MWVEALRAMQRAIWRILSFYRLLIPRLLGLRTGRKVNVGRDTEWPLGNLRNITIEDGVCLGKRGWFYLPLHNRKSFIHIKSGTAIGDDFVITANSDIRVGHDCLISYRVTLMDHSHITGVNINPVTSGLTLGKPVTIGDRCFIGCNVVIMPGVDLGENCIVGANAVVTKSFPANSILAGSPAKLLRTLTTS